MTIFIKEGNYPYMLVFTLNNLTIVFRNLSFYVSLCDVAVIFFFPALCHIQWARVYSCAIVCVRLHFAVFERVKWPLCMQSSSIFNHEFSLFFFHAGRTTNDNYDRQFTTTKTMFSFSFCSFLWMCDHVNCPSTSTLQFHFFLLLSLNKLISHVNYLIVV